MPYIQACITNITSCTHYSQNAKEYAVFRRTNSTKFSTKFFSSPSRILPYLIRQTWILWHSDYHKCIHAAKILAIPTFGELTGVGAGNGGRKDRRTVYLFAFARRQHRFATPTGYILKWQYPETINPIDSTFVDPSWDPQWRFVGGLLLPKRNSTWLPAAILKNRRNNSVWGWPIWMQFGMQNAIPMTMNRSKSKSEV